MALVSLKYKCALIHYPRTGGTSIRNLLGKSSLRIIGGAHCSEKVFDEALKTSQYKYMKFYKFGFTRHPYTYIPSLYNYILSHETHLEHEQVKGMTIDEFVSWYEGAPLLKERKAQDNRYLFQYEFFDNCDLYNFEDFANEIERLCKKLNIQTDKRPHINKSTGAKLTNKTKQLINDVFEGDFKRFKWLKV